MPYALCPMPYALCPMPYALCPMPGIPHLFEKGYIFVCYCKLSARSIYQQVQEYIAKKKVKFNFFDLAALKSIGVVEFTIG
ncbi:hypothetical protein [Microcoleus sp. bin38.metabat.b11b12b14.051]|uniref:hypothetical protein n=1 Tax=Microcoleus sp. bin38.metabat.b11b12b14.051 TaxID=2742709 RepID=UPI0025F92379|nr:hypothetical protein [Microcoleus sp. bin38.metabat.b11b12b14.051]